MLKDLLGSLVIIAVSLFAEKDNILEKNANHHGIFKGGSSKFLGIQVFGVTVIVCWAIVTSYASVYAINRFMGLRVSLLDEMTGADRIEHGIADINDPEGFMQIRRFLPRGAKIRSARTRQRVFSLKKPRHRNVYSFSDSNAKVKGTSVSNGNSFLASRDHEYTIRKRFRQAEDQSLPTTKRTRHHNRFKAGKYSDSSVMDNYVVTVDTRTHEGSVSDSSHEALSVAAAFLKKYVPRVRSLFSFHILFTYRNSHSVRFSRISSSFISGHFALSFVESTSTSFID